MIGLTWTGSPSSTAKGQLNTVGGLGWCVGGWLTDGRVVVALQHTMRCAVHGKTGHMGNTGAHSRPDMNMRARADISAKGLDTYREFFNEENTTHG